MDDTTRGVGPGDDVSGRSEETTRNYASPSTRTDPARTVPQRSAGSTRGTDPVSDDDLDPDTARRTRQIEGEIAHTRAELSETIDALQEKLRPGNLASEATERVKAATTEKVKSMAETASERAQEMVRDTRDRASYVIESTKRNPVPALMIGAGVAWMLMDRTRKGNGHREHAEWSEYSSPRYSSYDETRRYDRPAGSREPQRWSASEPGAVGNWAREATGEARQTARRAQNGLQRLMRQNPLLVGAAAMLVGAAVGASLPETDTENEWMGEARDTVVDRAQNVAQNAASAVKEAANDVVGDTVSKVAEKVTK